MSLDLYSHVIVPDEIEATTLQHLLVHDVGAAGRHTRDASVMPEMVP